MVSGTNLEKIQKHFYNIEGLEEVWNHQNPPWIWPPDKKEINNQENQPESERWPRTQCSPFRLGLPPRRSTMASVLHQTKGRAASWTGQNLRAHETQRKRMRL
ncbi:hypothetical protein XENORESO_017542 [Xenotaenia resolanae]|uniref:Uncharacterized protein n=1 Tax=Xenotaenia resolanae TaxID=208358 RepID=A0ABV0WRW6_9TELE